MNTYSHKRPCPKCGQKNIYNRFRDKGERIDDSIGISEYRREFAQHDLIFRHCRNCGYEWCELPKTAGI